MNSAFLGATSFNQNLCDWNAHLDLVNEVITTDAFNNANSGDTTGCPQANVEAAYVQTTFAAGTGYNILCYECTDGILIPLLGKVEEAPVTEAAATEGVTPEDLIDAP